MVKSNFEALAKEHKKFKANQLKRKRVIKAADFDADEEIDAVDEEVDSGEMDSENAGEDEDGRVGADDEED